MYELGLEKEVMLSYYKALRGHIKSVVKGKFILKKGEDWYVRFFFEPEGLQVIGVCSKRDQGFSDRIRFKEGLEKWFMIKNVWLDNGQLHVALTRQSTTFIKKLFQMRGVPESDILEVRRVPFKIKVQAAKHIPRDVIHWVSTELDESVIVRF